MREKSLLQEKIFRAGAPVASVGCTRNAGELDDMSGFTGEDSVRIQSAGFSAGAGYGLTTLLNLPALVRRIASVAMTTIS